MWNPFFRYRPFFAIYRRFSRYIDHFLEYIGDSTQNKDTPTIFDIQIIDLLS